jgi:hypothetical protein
MKYRRLDSAHDYCFGRSQSDYLSDSVGSPDAIAQAIQTYLLLFLGEWWENIKDGLPMWQKILGSRTKKAVIDKIITSRIRQLRTPEGTKAVTKVSNVRSTMDGRDYQFSCVVDTIFGKLAITNKNGGNS